MVNKKYNVFIRLVLGCVLYLFFSNASWAAEGCVGGECVTFTLFDTFIDGTIKGESSSMASKLADLAKNTFWILALIDFCWAAAIWVFEKDELNGYMSEFIKKIMTISFF